VAAGGDGTTGSRWKAHVQQRGQSAGQQPGPEDLIYRETKRMGEWLPATVIVIDPRDTILPLPSFSSLVILFRSVACRLTIRLPCQLHINPTPGVQRASRQANRDFWRNSNATVTRLYCTTPAALVESTRSGPLSVIDDGDDESYVSQATLTASAPFPNAPMEGRFRNICLHIDLARGCVTGEHHQPSNASYYQPRSESACRATGSSACVKQWASTT